MFITKAYHQLLVNRIVELERLNHDLIQRLLMKHGVPEPAEPAARSPEEFLKDIHSMGGNLFEEEELEPEFIEKADRRYQEEIAETQP